MRPARPTNAGLSTPPAERERVRASRGDTCKSSTDLLPQVDAQQHQERKRSVQRRAQTMLPTLMQENLIAVSGVHRTRYCLSHRVAPAPTPHWLARRRRAPTTAASLARALLVRRRCCGAPMLAWSRSPGGQQQRAILLLVVHAAPAEARTRRANQSSVVVWVVRCLGSQRLLKPTKVSVRQNRLCHMSTP